jgi:hypothetical protein
VEPAAALDGTKETKIVFPSLNSNLGRPDRNQNKYMSLRAMNFLQANIKIFSASYPTVLLLEKKAPLNSRLLG